jgi:very-short-patch-repair endonuclease
MTKHCDDKTLQKIKKIVEECRHTKKFRKKLIENELLEYIPSTHLNFSQNVYDLVYPNAIKVCKYGNSVKFRYFSDGYKFCGGVSTCKCASHSQKSSFKKTVSRKTVEEKSEIKRKREKTMYSRYGVNNPMKCSKIHDKQKKTMIINHGVEYSTQCEKLRNKGQETCIKNNGFKNILQSNISTEVLEILNNKECLGTLIKSNSILQTSEYLGVSRTTIREYLKKHELWKPSNGSTFEQNVSDFISKHVNCNFKNKNIIHPYEIDIFIPDKKIAIECNGSYWHSELQGRNKNYHLNKTKMCNEIGIDLIHIWEHDWDKNQSLIKNRLLSKVGHNNKIFARKTKIGSIPALNANYFLNSNHIQGACPASVRYGLYDGDELVAVMTFGKSRFSKKYEWELLRYCSSKQVIGGASKLFKHFQREHNPTSVVSYSDKMWNTGKVYEKLGFEYSHASAPSYYYTKNYVDFKNRVAYQKHKLEKKLEYFDSNLTEWENMQANGYDRIWDCGNDVWEWNFN